MRLSLLFTVPLPKLHLVHPCVVIVIHASSMQGRGRGGGGGPAHEGRLRCVSCGVQGERGLGAVRGSTEAGNPISSRRLVQRGGGSQG